MQATSNVVQDYLGKVETTVQPEYAHRADGKTMRALAWFGNSDVRMVDAPIPEITEPEDVILRVTGTTVCGSDLHLYHGEILTMQKGDILGHEFMGVVDKVGPEVNNLRPGQRVVASFQIACGNCKYCKQNLSSFCDTTNNSSLQQKLYGQRVAGIFGYSHLTGGFPGGQAEYVRVPKGNVNLLPIPDEVPDEIALYLSDILPTSYHCVVDTGVSPGDTVGIWGLGPIGLCVAQWCKIKGATRIIGIDKVPERLARAENKLQIETIDFTKHKDVAKRIYEMVPDGLDVALDCGTFHEPKTWTHTIQKKLMLETDVPETLNEMLVSVRKMGHCGLTGVYSGFANGVNVGALMEKGVRLIGNGQAPVHKYWKEILHDYLMTGKFDLKMIVTHRVPLEDMVSLYHAFDKRQAGVGKVFVETQFSLPPSEGFPRATRVDEWGSAN